MNFIISQIIFIISIIVKLDLFLQRQGNVEIQGKPEELYESGIDIVKLVGKLEQCDESLEVADRRRSSSKSLSSLGELEPYNEDENIEADEGVQMETSSEGTVNGPLIVNYFKAGAHWSILLVLFFYFIFVQFLVSSVDYWLSIWSVVVLWRK